MKYVLLVAIGMLSWDQQSLAADENGKYMVVGDGRISCEIWSSRRGDNGDASTSLEQWLFGYVTSFNRWVPSIVNIARGSNHEGLVAWVDNYCSRNPTQDVADAAEFLLVTLQKNRELSDK